MDEDPVRREIIDTARAYFLKYGYSRVSTAEIADEAGRSKKTLYKHFPTKEALLTAVLEKVTTGVEHEILLLLGNTALPGDERIRRVLERVGVHLAAVGNVLYDDLEAKEPALYGSARQQQRQVLGELLNRLLRAAVDDGTFRADADIPATVTTFLASIEALAKPGTVAAHADDPAALFSTLVGWVIAGLRR